MKHRINQSSNGTMHIRTSINYAKKSFTINLNEKKKTKNKQTLVTNTSHQLTYTLMFKCEYMENYIINCLLAISNGLN